MRSADPILIVGAGHAGVQLAASLRQMNFNGQIVLINGESDLPYSRPPLSKGFLKGDADVNSIGLRADAFFVGQRIDLIYDRVEQIDRDAGRVLLSSGSTMPYGHLVFATGARNRLLALPHADHAKVCYLRSIADGKTIRQHLNTARRAVVIGAGFIGLEFAATASAQGLEVSIVEWAPRFLGRAVSACVSRFYEAEHSAQGCLLRLGRSAASIEVKNGDVVGVTLDDGEFLAADLIVVGIGVESNTELAASAGLPVGNGIFVDDRLTTRDPNISAIGDCALFESRRYGGPMRIEAVSNSVDQAKFLADRLMGSAGTIDAVPWFWSDQGRNKLQIAGIARDVDRVILRGDVERSFSAFCYSAGRLVAVESVNRPGDHMAARRLLAADIKISPQQAADMNFDLKANIALATC